MSEHPDLANFVDLLVAPEYERRVSNGLMDWQRLQGTKSAMWTVGESGDGRKLFIDIPVAVVAYLREQGIPCDTRPRDPRRPLPA